ncbi:chondroitinase family polysaccharide lyase [Pedobacter nyackensis]|uniref:chondroitinase family polysaccharide lyase n=1 Tax=Pedobacter nyackensis TaxID=475255 RepID=UPI00292DBB25|nr:chondroitinase family polysaccharide lyase [Pedobacter nyackensis]
MMEIQLARRFACLLYLFLISCFSASNAFSQKGPFVESFEQDNVLKNYLLSGKSSISTSTKHYRYGKQALKWSWKGKDAAITTSYFSLLQKGMQKFDYNFPTSPTFVFSVYSESPQKGTASISFSKQGKDSVWFSFPLNFYGWRTLMVPFYEMQGNIPLLTKPVDFDSFKITANTLAGTLYFDDVVFSQYVDDRMQSPDYMVPFIKREVPAGADHFMPSLYFDTLSKRMKVLPITTLEEKELSEVELRISKMLQSAGAEYNYEVIVADFKKLGIRYGTETGVVLGPPLTHRDDFFYHDPTQQGPQVQNSARSLGQVLRSIAGAYVKANVQGKEKVELEKMFVLATRYFLDQGWQEGASGGSRSLIGYSIRELTEAFYMMKAPLTKAGLLNEIGGSLQWLNNLGKMLGPDQSFSVDLDFLNTQSYGCLLVGLLSDDKSVRKTWLQAYSNYMSVVLGQQDKPEGYKIDGTAWHHRGHYPAYAYGSFSSVPRILSALSGTSFRISEAGHRHFKKAFLAAVAYSNLYSWGFGNAGRHPLHENSIKGLKNSCLALAMSGNPEATSKIDPEVAGAYIRLWGEEDQVNTNIFKQAGITAQQPESYTVFPYGATAVHRKDKWAAIVKGYSKYLWASEIYAANNRYGRYPANGTVQLLKEEGEEASGFSEDGWDWNRYPGATVIHLPFEKLESPYPLLKFSSTQTFTGAVSLNGYGVFAMQLDEGKVNGGFSGQLKAKKSVFSFGEKLICIGTDISAVDPDYPVQTNLFQLSLSKNQVYTQQSGMVKSLPYQGKAGTWLIDQQGTGYHILAGDVDWQQSRQRSFKGEYSINKALKAGLKQENLPYTYGDFASAWINHGTTPENAAYQYVVYPFMNDRAGESFAKKIKNDDSYRILQADSSAHIVAYKPEKITAYVLFSEKGFSGKDVLSKVSAPCMVMVQQKERRRVKLSVAQPDLNFAVDKKNKNDFEKNSQPLTLSLSLNGLWTINAPGVKILTTYSNQQTIVQVECQHGFSQFLELEQK